MPPLIRRITRILPIALGALVYAVDDETGFAFIRMTKPNAILDMVNDPDPVAGLTYQVNVIKDGIDTGRRVFSTSISPLSAGRMSIGPIHLSPGDYSFAVAQTAGALAAQSFVIKFAGAP